MSFITQKNKNSNTFRFKSFTDRVNEIDIRQTALYYIGHENEEVLDDNETYFHQAIRKWSVLNLTEEFNEFSKRYRNIVTLPQLVHKKDSIIDYLLEKLSTSTTLSLQPLLEILVSLSKDLREDFSREEYFQRVLDRLICLLNTQDADQLEWTLVCLAFLFKTLKPFLKRNIAVIFHSILPLLDEERWSEHVINFAVECFAYIARDIINQEKLLEVVIRSVEREGKTGIHSYGRLFFEIIRGVNGNFHSVSEKFLPFFFKSLINPKLEQKEIIFEIIHEMVLNTLAFVHSTNMSIFWTSLCEAAEKALELNVKGEMIIRLVEIIGISIEYKSGKFLTESELLVGLILKIADSYSESEMVLIKLSALICCILLSNYFKITQLDLSRLCKKILNVKSRSVFEYFVWNIKSHPQFEILVLPSFLKFFELHFDINSLELLIKIIQFKSPLCEDGRKLDNWKKYPILVKQQTEKNLLNIIENHSKNEAEIDQQYLLTVIALPHIENIKHDYFAKLIKKDLQNFAETILEAKSEKEIQKRTFMLAVLIENAYHLEINIEEKISLNLIKIIIQYCGKEKFISSLKLLNLVLAFHNKSNKSIFTSELFDIIHEAISNNLYSPLQDFRSLTADTLNYFNCLGLNGVYNVIYKIESIEPSIHTYREKLVLINKFLPSGEFMKNVTRSHLIFDSIKSLLGMLYYNFKLLWEPILKVIQELTSSGLSITEFWEIYKSKIESTARIINKEETDPTIITFEEEFNIDILQEIYRKRLSYEIKVDYKNYRNLLWSKLSEYGQVIEIKNRDIVTIFLKFVNQEYKAFQEQKTLTWNLVESSKTLDLIDEEDNEKSNLSKPLKQSKQSENTLKDVVQTLGTKLNVFINQDNPKQMHRENELFNLYLELLTCTNPFLQKLALDCILAYKNNSLLQYKEHLYNLIDEKKFKDELVSFKIDKESNEIQPQHRPEVMKILLRILYGKMIMKSVAKNINNQVKKGLLLRFLGGCEKEEIFWFLRMALKDYGGIIENNLNDMIAIVDKEFNLERVWSAKKLQSTINLIELIHKNFAGLMDIEFLIFMLRVIIFVGFNCEKILQNSAKISNPKLLVVFKNVKTLALQSIIHFTKHFEEFEWQNEQINKINEIFVWSNIKKLPYDCIHSPTPLLKLLCAWSENIKHLSYLILKSKSGLVSFKFVIDLLLNDKAKPIIRKTILEMIERILTSGQDESGRFDTNSIAAVIVRPYLPQILKRLKLNLSLKGGRKKLDKRDLNILSSLTYLVQDSETCDSLLQIFLPILLAKTRTSTSDDILQQAILTLCNLIKKVDNPVSYLRKICLLFVEVKEVTSRKLICNLLDIIAKKCQIKSSHLLELSKIVNELNAWDKRWIEQPDYDRRITTMRNISKSLDTELINMDLGVLVVCNCFHFLKYDKDMGLRDNSSELLKVLIPKLLKDNQHLRNDIDFMISEILLDIIRKIIRDNNDTVRGEGILLLGEMAKECYMFHPILNDLFQLSDSQDEEVDFFHNITHIQAHRHAKGLQRFCNVSKNLTELPNVKTLTQFILPLTTRYLLNEKYASKHTLIDTAIDTIGVICQLLPWQQYQTLLKFYLQKMRFANEYQKQAVRIVVTILDAFHFDLSNSNVEEKMMQSFKKQFATELKLEEAKTSDQPHIDARNFKEINNESLNKSKMGDSTVMEETKLEDELVEEGSEDESLKDEYLDEELADLEDEREFTNIEKSKCVMIATILGSSAAKKIIHTIASILIPTLNNSITEKSSYDTKHKLNRKRYSIEREEEEILRVPIALALVKLLQKLPKEILETSLPGIFMKVCTFLKSPLKSVRMLTRDILKKIMITLGSKYLPLLLEQLKSLLTRGFQVHVLSVTVHGVLDVLKEQFQPGDIELCLQDILQVTLNDIFGEISEEKEIDKIGVHTPEAKPSAKSYLSLHIAARNIPESCLLDLLIPFKEYLAKNHSQKVVSKIEICFQKIITGLVENSLISKESLLYFIYGTISESITDLLPGTEKPQLSEKEKERIMRSRPDCFLIPEPPKYRSGFVRKTVKTNMQANSHVLIEFGLEMLNIVLKRKQITKLNYEPFLNPIIPVLNDSLKSQHIKVTTFALKCFTSIWNGDYKIKKCEEYLNQIIEQIFKILHKYSTFGAVKRDDNFQLVKNSFKTIVALLRNVEDFSMSSEQIGQLLLYIEQDILEAERQPIAMTLLKAIVFRKIRHEEIHNVMKNLQEIAITSQSDFLRDEIRSILVQYLMDYPLKKKSDGIIKFFTMQLNYEVPTGRQSAIKFIEMIIRKLPQNVLLKKAEFLYLQLGTRLVNEEVPDCRIAVAECIEQLIGRIDKQVKQKLFDINLMLLDNGQKPAIREMAATLFSRFINVEKNSFSPRIKVLLPILIASLSSNNPKAPGRFVKAPSSNEIGINVENVHIDEAKNELIWQEKQKAVDHELIQIQNCILKMLEFCSDAILDNTELHSMVDELAYECQKLLGYEHDWVRLNSIKIIGYIVSNIDSELVGNLLMKQVEMNENYITFLHMTPETDIKSLVLDLCAQMIPGQTSENMVEEIAKIFLLIANILKAVPIKNIKKETTECDGKDGTESSNIHLNWLLRRMRYIIQGEISKAPHSCVLRTSIFNCFEGLITMFDVNLVEKLAMNILWSLVREMSEEDQNVDSKLRQQAIRIGSKLRKSIGSDSYDKLRTEIQTKLMIKRAQRRKEIAVQKVVDPVTAAKRKQGIQLRKKAAKKRKMDIVKGKIEGKKKRKRKIDDDLF